MWIFVSLQNLVYIIKSVQNYYFFLIYAIFFVLLHQNLQNTMLSNYFTASQTDSVREFIQTAQHIVIVTHMSPDGDAMGSSLGMRHYLKHIGKTSITNIVPNSFPSFLAWMPDADKVIIYDEHQAEADAILSTCDLLICTDFNEPKRIGSLWDKIQNLACP